jgi:hypothetical protein
MAEEYTHIDIGFTGGQVLPVRVTREGFEGLRRALSDSGPDRWHELKTQDSDVALDLSKIVYVRLDTEEHRVGF